MKIYDKVNIELNIGDYVCFASSVKDDSLYFGYITGFTKSNAVTILKEKGRLNTRAPIDVLSLKPQQNFIPEFFI